RVRAVLRRTERPPAKAELITAGDLVLDVPRLKTTVAGRAVELTPTEFQLLAALAAEPGRVFTRAQLLETIRGVAFESYERAIDAVVAIAVAVLLRAFGLAGGWAVLAVVLVGMLLVVPAVRGLRLFATPLGDLVGAAGQVEAGDLSVRVRERGPRGVRSLVRAFNAMTARPEASQNARR